MWLCGGALLMTRLLSLRFVSACAALAVLGCGTAFAQPTPDTTAAAAADKPSIKLIGVIMALPAGASWLSLGAGSSCEGPVQKSTGGRVPQDLPPFAEAFKTQLAPAGYKVVSPIDNVFDPEAGAADYQAAAVITDAYFKACVGGLFSGHGVNQFQGDGTMGGDWQIYSPIKKELVARVRTSVADKLDGSVQDSVQGIILKFFTANARALAANADFRTAMNAPSPLAKGFVMPGRQSGIALAGNLKAGPRSIADAVGSVVTLITSDATGSGVLVSNDGYFLTNAHVVGDEKELRVRWSDGIETLGQVVRVAKDRDVALIKTGSRDRTPLAIKRGAVTPGQKVYAIGSPNGPKFQGTVSSGVVSAVDRIYNGLRYIQSDTMVSFGSSGGALLDEKGSLIGLTDIGVQNAGQPAGLNLFIPIGDALDFLSLEPQ